MRVVKVWRETKEFTLIVNAETFHFNVRREGFTLRVCALIAFQMIFYLHSSQTNTCIVRKENMMHFSTKDNLGGISQRVSMFSLKGTSLKWILFFCLSNKKLLTGTSLEGFFLYLSNYISQRKMFDVSHENTRYLSKALLSYFSIEQYTWMSPVIKNRRTLWCLVEPELQ